MYETLDALFLPDLETGEVGLQLQIFDLYLLAERLAIGEFCPQVLHCLVLFDDPAVEIAFAIVPFATVSPLDLRHAHFASDQGLRTRQFVVSRSRSLEFSIA